MASLLAQMQSAPSRPSKERMETYGTRSDGTPKGPGYFGEIPNRDKPSQFSTELSGEATVDGKTLLFPLLVPTLTRKEIESLVRGKVGPSELDMIYKKAIDHALMRKKQGKDPFAGEDDFLPLPQE